MEFIAHAAVVVTVFLLGVVAGALLKDRALRRFPPSQRVLKAGPGLFSVAEKRKPKIRSERDLWEKENRERENS